MQMVESSADLRQILKDWRMAPSRIAFVPTMGNLHDGHLHLMQQAKSHADKVVASIFVNPTQFSAGEDFNHYPRTPEADIKKLAKIGVDAVFMPSVAEIYPSDAISFVEVPGLSEALCGQFRPGHFRGVATVVCKLFNIVQPDVALFGEKDWQQLQIIRRMVADLYLPVAIIGVPTVRESNGLAMSSRNGYLTETEKQQATLIYQSLLAAKAALESGERDYAQIEATQSRFLMDAGFKPDYFAIRRAADMSKPDMNEREWVILTAAWLGKARLIDNLSVQV